MPGAKAQKPDEQPTGAAEAPKEEARPVPPPELPKKPLPMPELPADQLSQISRRVSALEKSPVTQLPGWAVFLLAVLAIASVLVVALLAALFARRFFAEKR